MIFNADIARDFLLFSELDKDPIMLIGPRADYKGLFHGPAWLYVNYPAYVVGGGNPIVVASYWLLLTAVFAGVCYWVGARLFDKLTGGVFAGLFVVSTMHYVNQFYNPTGAMFIAPLFLYCAYQYAKTQKLSFMLGQLFLAGMMLQFQLAAGIPILLLSGAALLYLIMKHKNFSHLGGFLILLIPLSTFILFELKFGFSQFQAILNHFNGTEKFYSLSLEDKLADRYSRIVGPGLGFFSGKYGHFNQFVALLSVGTLGYALSRARTTKKHTNDMSIYWWGLYYYVGFYVLSLVHNGSVLLHYYLPFMFIPVLLFSSMHRWIDKRAFGAVIVLIMAINISHLADLQKENASRRGTHFTSWVALSEALRPVRVSAQDREIGLFVYAPDTYAYAPKYAALYLQKKAPQGHVHINEKLPETYLFYEPTPEKLPWLNGAYWKTDLVKISSPPIATDSARSGYRLERYSVSEEDRKRPIDPLALDWVSQR
jgi:hypothetical protein